MNGHPAYRPIRTVPFFTGGTLVLLAVVALGAFFAFKRFIFGIGAVTNLGDQYPWGIWIAVDVAAGVALAAGGFTTSALAHIFHRDRYLSVVRPALLTALLGYTFVGIALLFDLGMYYNIWHPMVMWQGNSVLFEVGICVMSYLAVLYLEFLPIVLERFKDGPAPPGPLKAFGRPARAVLTASGKVLHAALPALILLGVVLSCLHQSSLGALMLVAPTKMHPLWFTPMQPMLFLCSAVAVGYPMVIIESMIAARSLGLEPEMEVLTPLSRFIPVFLGIYLALKVSDLAIRGAWVHLLEGSVQGVSFILEVLLGVCIPLVILLFDGARRNRPLLFLSALLVAGGVVVNRINVFLVAYSPPFMERAYFPALGEFAITAAMAAAIALAYKFAVMNFPVMAGRVKS